MKRTNTEWQLSLVQYNQAINMCRSFLHSSLLLSLTLLGGSGCDVSGLVAGKQASRTVQYSMPLPASGKCIVRTRNGRINCVAGNVSEIVIKAEIKARGGSIASAQKNAKRITVERTDDKGVAEIKANVPRSTNGSVSLTLILPAEVTLDLETTNGSVNVVDMTGVIEAETTNGRVAIIGTDLKSVSAETTNGSLHLKGMLQAGEHELETTNGSVHVELTGTPLTIEASTNNGLITANGLRLGKGSKVTLGAEGNEIVTSHLTVETTNGSITMTHGIPAEALPAVSPTAQL